MKYLAEADSFGKTKKSNTNNHFNLHVPSNQTLNSYEDVRYYLFPPLEEVACIKATASKYSKKFGCD